MGVSAVSLIPSSGSLVNGRELTHPSMRVIRDENSVILSDRATIARRRWCFISFTAAS